MVINPDWLYHKIKFFKSYQDNRNDVPVVNSIPEFIVIFRFYISKDEANNDYEKINKCPDKPGFNTIVVDNVNYRQDDVECYYNNIECFEMFYQLLELIH
jgi:hypothetical protein